MASAARHRCPEIRWKHVLQFRKKWYYLSRLQCRENGKSYFIEVYGRVCNLAARFLTGKHKPTYKNDDPTGGDIVVILNAEKLYMSKKRMMFKELIYHTGYVGHLRRVPFKEMVFKKPEVLFRQCIFKMLPKNKKRFPRLKKLFIYRD